MLVAVMLGWVLIAGGLPAGRPAPAVDAAAQLDRFLAEQVAAQHIPGLAVAITRGDEVVLLKGYGTAGAGRPVMPQTQFMLASLSKSFTALAVMQLVEAGAIELDAPVQRYLPDFTTASPQDAAAITIRQLLNQRSGLADPGFPEMRLPQPASLAERAASLRTARPVAAPGSEYHYFNPNYGLLARVVEVVSGRPFAEYVRGQIFDPLGMRGSLVIATSDEAARLAPALAQGHIMAFGFPLARPELSGFLGGSGGVIATAEDLAAYLIMQNSGGSFGASRLVSAPGLALMHTPPDGSAYAMGWLRAESQGVPVIEHNGIISTFYSEAVLLPDSRVGIAILANVHALSADALAFPRIKNGLVALLTGGSPPSGGMTTGQLGLALGLGMAAHSLWALRRLLRLRRWADRARAQAAWRRWLSVALSLAPAGMLLALPSLLTQAIDRAFSFAGLWTAMFEVMLWLSLIAALGLIAAAGKVVLLRRDVG
jgi:CubicO group peptidase (beta-lactamase class C family)